MSRKKQNTPYFQSLPKQNVHILKPLEFFLLSFVLIFFLLSHHGKLLLMILEKSKKAIVFNTPPNSSHIWYNIRL